MIQSKPDRYSSLLYPALLFLIPFALAAVFALGGREMDSKAERLREDSVDGIATVLETRRATRRSGNQLRRHYFVTFRFEPERREAITRESEVSLRFYSRVSAMRLRGEETIPIRYSRASPDLHEIDPGSKGSLASRLRILAIVLGSLSLYPLGITIRRAILLAKC